MNCLGLGAAALVLSVSTASAATVTVYFTSVLDGEIFADDAGILLGQGVTQGSSVSGSFTYDDAAPLAAPAGPVAGGGSEYLYGGTGYTFYFELTFGSGATMEGTTEYLYLYDDIVALNDPDGLDAFGLLGTVTNSSFGLVDEFASIYLVDFSATAFSGGLPDLSTPGLFGCSYVNVAGATSSAETYIFFAADGGCTYDDGEPQPSQVPLPAGAVFFFSALAMLSGVSVTARRRKG